MDNKNIKPMQITACVLGFTIIAGAAAYMINPNIIKQGTVPYISQQDEKDCTDCMEKKPAIYLYPEIAQKIEIKLDKTIKYKTVIPKYNKKTGWVVEAEPTGIIRDLQPKFTDCKKLPNKEFGLEYSLEACQINKYPYIYWDGVQLAKPLPNKQVGFHVKRDDIVSFLTAQADVFGMNTNEKKEFVRYWSKQMQDTDWKYFRVYFLQNEEVDNYLPISVNPVPKNSNRLQIIIRKAEKRAKIEEQKLIPFNRDGYTLVEWGGMIKK